VLGPILGGALLGPLGWQAIFWANVPLVLASLAGGLALLPEGPVARAARPDLPGQALGTAALAGLVFALIEGGRAGFGSLATLAGGAFTLAALVGFIAVERRSRRPLLDLGWFGRAEFSGANAGSALMNLGTLGGIFAIGLYLQQDRGLSPLAGGLGLPRPRRNRHGFCRPGIGRRRDRGARRRPRRYRRRGQQHRSPGRRRNRRGPDRRLCHGLNRGRGERRGARPRRGPGAGADAATMPRVSWFGVDDDVGDFGHVLA
jgi:hypothetical protein